MSPLLPIMVKMDAQERERLHEMICTKNYSPGDFSFVRYLFHAVLFFQFVVLWVFGVPFIGIALISPKLELNQSIIGVSFFLILISVIGMFTALSRYRAFKPRTVELRRSVIVFTNTAGLVIRLPYSRCFWSRRTCFAFYGIFTCGSSWNGLLIWSTKEKFSETPFLLVSLSSEEKRQWIEKLKVSCREIRPSYFRMAAIFLVPFNIVVPILAGIGLAWIFQAPNIAWITVLYSLMFGPIAGLPALGVTYPPEVRMDTVHRKYRFGKRWGLFLATTGIIALPLIVVFQVAMMKNANILATTIWCVVFYVSSLFVTGALTNIYYEKSPPGTELPLDDGFEIGCRFEDDFK